MNKRTFVLLALLWLAFRAAASAYYDPTTQSFLSRDPIREEGGVNLYAYCGNDPVGNYDPIGLEAVVFIRNKEGYERAIALQKLGEQNPNFLDGLWRTSRDVHILPAFNENAPEQAYFSGVVTGAEYNGRVFDQGYFIGTDAAWFFGDTVHAKIVTDWFNSGNTLRLLTAGAATAIGVRVPGPSSVPELIAPSLLQRPSYAAGVSGISTSGLNSGVSLGRIEAPRTVGLGDSITMADLLRIGGIPGRQGVKLVDRTVQFADIWKLSEQNGIEYALTREEGSYILRSGAPSRVSIPAGVRPIAHTHPLDMFGAFEPLPSRADISALDLLYGRMLSSDPYAVPPASQVIWGPNPGNATPFWPTIR